MKLTYEILTFLGLTLIYSISAFGGSEEKFIKKYAMMKVYESCFGPQVLKEVRREMKEAAQKCSGFQPDFDDKYIHHEPSDIKPVTPSYHEKPYRPKPISNNKVKRPPIHTTDTLLLQQWAEEQKLTDTSDQMSESEESENQAETANETENEATTSPTKKPLDLSKLEEAIMNIGRPLGHFGVHRPGYSPSSATNPNFHQTANIGYYPPPMYYPPPPVPYPAPAPAHSYPYHAYYPGYYQPPGPAQAPANQPQAYPPYYRGSHRSAKITKDFEVRENRKVKKDLDVKAQIDAMTFHSGAKMRNITCVMQELGYLDEHLEPNYDRMMERINKLQVPEELKRDMVDGVKFCKQFSQCVPETRKDKFQLSKELLRPMFFFRCYKHKKLEACIMKDVRERFSQTSVDDNNSMSNELRRSFRNNDLASTIFEFMYGSSTEDIETLL